MLAVSILAQPAMGKNSAVAVSDGSSDLYDVKPTDDWVPSNGNDAVDEASMILERSLLEYPPDTSKGGGGTLSTIQERLPQPHPLSSRNLQQHSVVFNGKKYMTLDNVDPEQSVAGCQTEPLPLPAGFRIAKNDANARNVTVSYKWGTHCIVLADGSSWGTKVFHPGADCWINKESPLVEFNLRGYVPRGCARRILLEEAPPSSLLPCDLQTCLKRPRNLCETQTTCTCQQVGKPGVSFGTVTEPNAIGFNNRQYRTMDHTHPMNTTIGCQTSALKVPAGWSLASTWGDWEPRTVAASFPWGTTCLVVQDGKFGFRGWGTMIGKPLKECTHRGIVAINRLAKTYRPARCSRRILLWKSDQGLKCLPA